MKKRTWIFLLIACFAVVSCEKNIDVDFPPGESPYVIEGYIEEGQFPLVTISRGISFLSNISPDNFRDLFVKNAIVSIRVDNGPPVLLSKLELQGVVIYTTTAFTGNIGSRYELMIEADGKTFTGSTTILPPQGIDSISVEPAPGDHYEKDSLVRLVAHFNEPNPRGNYYRLLTRRNSDFFFDTGYNSVFDDQYWNGTNIEFTVIRGKSEFQNNDTANFNNFGYFKRGDTVYVKWASIDKAQYDFWNTFEAQSSSFGNPFASTVIIKSNVKGKGSVGLWGSYGSFLDTLIIP